MQCPGQDSRYWDGEAIFEAKCPKCSNTVEFFKDESRRKCKQCGHKVLNPKLDFGCATYCPFAEQCLGGALPADLLAKKLDLLKDKVAVEMKRYFGGDFKRIGHASRVARHAEEILQTEKAANPAVVHIAAYLHDIGIHEAEKKHNSTAARYQHEEGPPIAREILIRLRAEDELVDEVCDIIGHHHHPREEETLNFKVLYDADLLANLEDQYKENQPAADKVKRVLESFLTEGGKKVAENVITVKE